jgi:hypothetical protein
MFLFENISERNTLKLFNVVRQIIVFYSENNSKLLKNSVAKMWFCGMLRKMVHMANQGCTNVV